MHLNCNNISLFHSCLFSLYVSFTQVALTDAEKNRKLNDLLDTLEFNQVVIFVSSPSRCQALNKFLNEFGFPSIAMYGGLNQVRALQKP